VTGLWAGWSGVWFLAEVRLFSSSECPDWLCGSPKLLQNGYLRFCPWGNAAEMWSQPPTGISAEVKNEWSYTFSPSLCLYVVDRGTTYFTFASINDCVTYPANCTMVPGNSWHGRKAGKTLSCLPPSSADVNVWSFTITFPLTYLCGMALWCLENFIWIHYQVSLTFPSLPNHFPPPLKCVCLQNQCKIFQ